MLRQGNGGSPARFERRCCSESLVAKKRLLKMASVHPLRRIGTVEEIADAVMWLFSDESSYYTGQSLTLDGGLTAQRPSSMFPVSSANGLSDMAA
jgi:NAD(P)-dependent dehydrogenase (short-subunit alcohol dehydrogenase family)